MLGAIIGDILGLFYERKRQYIIRGNYEEGKLKEGSKVTLRGAQYEVIHTCGHGSYGEIFKIQCVKIPWGNKLRNLLCLSRNNNETLAIKRFRMCVLEDFQATRVSEITAKWIFKRGYDDMSRLSHPNIVKVYDYFAMGDIPCFTMEYVEGYNLKKIVERKGCLSEKAAKDIILTICKTIKYCHEKDVFHGDLKPNNVMITPKGTIKLIDFGGAYHCSDIVGIAKVYFYLLTGVYLSTYEHRRPTQETKERVVAILSERNASNLVKSQILFMLYDLSAPFQSQTNSILDKMIHAVENDELLYDSNMPSRNDEVIGDNSEFIVFEQAGRYGMKNKQGEIVIQPMYSRISSIGFYHIPGPGPRCWHVVGVMTYREGFTGWYEIVDGNQMKKILELAEEQIKERQMWT